MKRIRFYFTFLLLIQFVVLLNVSFVYGLNIKKSILGKWYDQYPSQTFEFIADGTVIIMPFIGGKQEDIHIGTFRFIDKNRLLMEFQNQKQVLSQISFKDNEELIMTDIANGEKTHFYKGEKANNNILLYKLFEAIDKSDLKKAKMVLSNGTDINNTSRLINGPSPLIYASSWNKIEIVKLLITYGADVNIKDKNGLTALMWAARKGHHDIVESLLNAKAKKNMKSNQNLSALDYALQEKHVDIADLLQNADLTK